MTGRRVVEVTRRGRIGSDGQSNLVGVVSTAVDATVLNEDSGKAYRCTDDLTLTLPPATTVGWSLIVDADGGDVTLSAAMTINGAASLVVSDGNSCLVYSDGSAMYARFYFADELSSALLTSIAASSVTIAEFNRLSGVTSAIQPQLNAIQPQLDAIETLVDAVSAASMPIATLSSGAGQCVFLDVTVGAGLQVPAGGEWFHLYLQTVNSTGSLSNFKYGISAGGTVLDPGTGGRNWFGVAWRIS